MGLPSWVPDALYENLHHTTCTIRLNMPIIGNVFLKPTVTRATEACGVTDAMKRGEATFDEYLAESIALVAENLSAEKHAEFDQWLATVPVDVVKEVRDAVDTRVPRGHRCSEGGPHYNVALRWEDAEAWKVEAHGTTVVLHGPGPEG